MKRILFAPLGLCLITCGTTNTKDATSDKKNPNIIFFMADDLGLGDLQAYNHDSSVPTPYINRLAEMGTLFTNVHSPASLSSPSRYSVLTGRYAWREGYNLALQGISEPMIVAGQPTVGKYLQKNGYRTALIGKWHIGMRFAGDYEVLPQMRVSKMPLFDKEIIDGPLDHGFDYFFGIEGNFNIPQTCDFFIENRMVLDPGTIHEKGLIHKSTNQVVSGYVNDSWKSENLTRLCLEKALWFIDNHIANHPGQPFYLHFVPNAIHTPFTPNDSLNGELVKGRGGLCEKRGELIVELDIMVGAIIQDLKRHNVLENTLFVFTSDNGAQVDAACEERGHHSSLGWAGTKFMILEGGHRVPFIVSYPAGGVKAGAVNNSLFGLIDWFSSVKGLVKGKTDANVTHLDSEDFSALYTGKNLPQRSRLLIVSGSNRPTGDCQHPIFNRSTELLLFNAVYNDNLKLILNMDNGTPKYLFDLKTNPEETADLLKQNPELVKDLKIKYQEAVNSLSERPDYNTH